MPKRSTPSPSDVSSATKATAAAPAPSPHPAPATLPSARATPSRLQMADIAHLAGVSVSTVSRALSGSDLVNESTRARVAELARSLNYAINTGAQSLRTKQNRTISVVVPFDAASREHLSDPFFLSLIGSLADAITDRGYEMLLSRIDAESLHLAAQAYDSGRAAGIILIGQWHHHDQLNEMAVRGIPLVVWGAQLAEQVYPTVGSDNQQGGFLATSHLIAQGARRIAFFGDPQLPEVGLRCRGYVQAHERHHIEHDPALVRPVPFEPETVKQAVQQLCAEGLPFDAVFAASDLMAMTVIAALGRLDRQVPRDVLVIGYDDIELAKHFHPPLTTVRQPMMQAGQSLVSQLLKRMEGERIQPMKLPTSLEIRESARRLAS
jgi:DNA-binding LacI/PurR family transcriptional regulator